MNPKTSPHVHATEIVPRNRIVCALTAEEHKLFIGASASEFDQLQAEVVWLNESELVSDHWGERLRALAPNVLVTAWGAPTLPIDWLQEPDCSLRYLCHITGSVRRLVSRVFLEKGGLVTNWGTEAAAPVAEHALLLGLAALRSLPAWRPYLYQPPADRSFESLATRSLFRRRVGLHGFGAVARELVSLLQPFRPVLAAYSAGVPRPLMKEYGVEPCDSLTELFARSEVLFDCEALNAVTEGSVSAAVLASLPDGAVFVNVGRGRIADEGALLSEARSGRIRVAVDVTAHEPVTAGSPWLQAETALVSPHIGGPTLDLYPEFGRNALRNLRRFLAGETLTALVTPESYDRST